MVDLQKAQQTTARLVTELLKEDGIEHDVQPDMPLIGGDSALDSMKLVELCVRLEDEADELGFAFDWTSENAMSKSRSMFRTVASLSEEFANQSKVEA